MLCRMSVLGRSLLAWVVAAGAGCGPAAIDGGFDSPNPAARMYAIEHAAREGDTTAIPRIIEALDSDDPAVRWLAILSLQRLTGETFGYRHYDPTLERRDAVARWIDAYARGAFEIRPPTAVPSGIDAEPPATEPAPSTMPLEATTHG